MFNSANIVCIGNWNVKIFTPEWVANNIFEIPQGEELNIEFLPNEIGFLYKKNNIIFAPKDNMIELKLQQFNIETLPKMVECLKKILQLLPHTPIKAFGFNIKSVLKQSESPFLDYLISQSKNMELNGYNIAQLNLTKMVDKCLQGIVVNKNSDDSYAVTFNYQYDYNMGIDIKENQFEIILSDATNTLKQ